jgi:hypothetical protein
LILRERLRKKTKQNETSNPLESEKLTIILQKKVRLLTILSNRRTVIKNKLDYFIFWEGLDFENKRIKLDFTTRLALHKLLFF